MLIYIILFLALVSTILILYAIRQIPGCSGDCRQGRDPCNCKRNLLNDDSENQELVNTPKDSIQGG